MRTDIPSASTWAIEFSMELRKEVEAVTKVVIPAVGLACRFCNSDKIIKFAVRHNKYGDVQRYRCNACGKRFSFNIGFEGMRASPQVITSAMQLYFTGESLRNVQRFIRLQGFNVSHVTVYNWIKKYVGLMQQYLDKITPNVSDTWRTDELYLKIKGNMKYLYALMDDQTRFWIAQQISDSKYTQDVRPLFHEAKEVAGKRRCAQLCRSLQKGVLHTESTSYQAREPYPSERRYEQQQDGAHERRSQG
jgi:transposase-like protein